MGRELDKSYKNLQIQKKYLSNCRELHRNNKAYQNDGMLKTISDTEKLIESIMKTREETNDYGLVFDFCLFMEHIGIAAGTETLGTLHDWFDTSHLIKWFGADAINPVRESSTNAKGSSPAVTNYYVYYNDDGTVRRKVEILP